jgi:hypothetical protein
MQVRGRWTHTQWGRTAAARCISVAVMSSQSSATESRFGCGKREARRRILDGTRPLGSETICGSLLPNTILTCGAAGEVLPLAVTEPPLLNVFRFQIAKRNITQIAASAWQRAQEALNRPGRSCRHMPSARPAAGTCASASFRFGRQLPAVRIEVADQSCLDLCLPGMPAVIDRLKLRSVCNLPSQCVPATKFFRSGRPPEHGRSLIFERANEVPLPALWRALNRPIERLSCYRRNA